MVKTAPLYKYRLKLNLLYPQGVKQKIYIRFLLWLIAYGRFIVVAVEILVLAAFVMRFKLDSDFANLKEEINDKIPYAESLISEEATIEQTQQRLSLIKKAYAVSGKFKQVLATITSQTPDNIRFNNFTLDNIDNTSTFQFKITAQSNSNSSISFFLNNLRRDQKLKDVKLVNISFDQGQIVFTITGVAL